MHTLLVELAVGSRSTDENLEHARTHVGACTRLGSGGGSDSDSGDATAALLLQLQLPQRQAPHLGALCEFLLGRWQVEAAHERALIVSASAV
jgi:hypothetical protein